MSPSHIIMATCNFTHSTWREIELYLCESHSFGMISPRSSSADVNTYSHYPHRAHQTSKTNLFLTASFRVLTLTDLTLISLLVIFLLCSARQMNTVLPELKREAQILFIRKWVLIWFVRNAVLLDFFFLCIVLSLKKKNLPAALQLHKVVLTQYLDRWSLRKRWGINDSIKCLLSSQS